MYTAYWVYYSVVYRPLSIPEDSAGSSKSKWHRSRLSISFVELHRSARKGCRHYFTNTMYFISDIFQWPRNVGAVIMQGVDEITSFLVAGCSDRRFSTVWYALPNTLVKSFLHALKLLQRKSAKIRLLGYTNYHYMRAHTPNHPGLQQRYKCCLTLYLKLGPNLHRIQNDPVQRPPQKMLRVRSKEINITLHHIILGLCPEYPIPTPEEGQILS